MAAVLARPARAVIRTRAGAFILSRGSRCCDVVVVDKYQAIVFLGGFEESDDGKRSPDEEHIYISHI